MSFPLFFPSLIESARTGKIFIGMYVHRYLRYIPGQQRLICDMRRLVLNIDVGIQYYILNNDLNLNASAQDKSLPYAFCNAAKVSGRFAFAIAWVR